MAKKNVKKKAKPAANKKAEQPATARSTRGASPANAAPTKRTLAAGKKSAAKKVARPAERRPTSAANKSPNRRRRGAADDGALTLPTSLDPVQFSESRTKKVKTHLTAKQLREFKRLLELKRAELCGDVERLTSEALHKDSESGNDHSVMPIHMADLGTDNWEQDFTLGLIANEEALVRDIDEALARIENKTYGICVATQRPISVARLQVKPWAKYCIEYARMRDEGRLR